MKSFTVSTLLFFLAHLLLIQGYRGLINYLVMALCLGSIRKASTSIGPSFLAHAANNFFAFLPEVVRLA